jgi:hypothetical protein
LISSNAFQSPVCRAGCADWHTARAGAREAQLLRQRHHSARRHAAGRDDCQRAPRSYCRRSRESHTAFAAAPVFDAHCIRTGRIQDQPSQRAGGSRVSRRPATRAGPPGRARTESRELWSGAVVQPASTSLLCLT